MRKTEIEIIQETIESYTSETRAIDSDGRCQYLTADGRSCAFGRCCLDPGKLEAYFPGQKVPENPDLYLKPEYRGHERPFWLRLQHLHDSSRYWEKDGISKEGLDYILSHYPDFPSP